MNNSHCNLMIQGSMLEVIEAIHEAEHIFIFHHTRPDGDCLGAMFGLKELLKLNFPTKKVFCVGHCHELFPFMNWQVDNWNQIPQEYVANKSLAILVDANYAKRVELGTYLVNQPFVKRARIDHHPAESDINFHAVYVDANKAACCEQIAHMAMVSNWKLNATAAKSLALGIYTDTGRFNFDNVSFLTYDVMEWLLDCFEFDYFALTTNLMARSQADLAFRAHVLQNFHFSNRLVWFLIDRALMNKFNLTEQAGSEVNILANIGNAQAWIFFIEMTDHTYRVRLRSNSIDVDQVAQQFRGGGHTLAAGAIIEKHEIAKVLEVLWTTINNYEPPSNNF